MKKRLALIALLLLVATAVANQIYTYRCPKCGLIQQYDKVVFTPKCPADGWRMERR